MNKKIFNYKRWEYTITQERLLKESRLEHKEFLQMLKKYVFHERVLSLSKQDNYYKVVTEKRKEYSVVFERPSKGSYYVIILHEDYYTAYGYMIKPVRFSLSYQVFEYKKGSPEEIMFHCTYNDYLEQYLLWTKMFNCIDVTFTSTRDASVVELVRDSDYSFILDAITRYKANECGINELFEVYNLIFKKITSKVYGFTVKVESNYSLTYSCGMLKEMRIVIDGHYVICDSSGKLIWQENLIHHEDFAYANGKVYDGKMNEVTDSELAQKIVSNINEGKAIFDSFQQKLSSN
ncbi:MAG: hypothetical protein K2H53_02600 [Clostridia bacterium]|nr:hypothetical protein [Clostridia bacterium]